MIMGLSAFTSRGKGVTRPSGDPYKNLSGVPYDTSSCPNVKFCKRYKTYSGWDLIFIGIAASESSLL